LIGLRSDAPNSGNAGPPRFFNGRRRERDGSDPAPRVAAESPLLSPLVRVALVALAILPLVVGSIWIYGASAGAFRLQHQIRIAQNGRNDVMRLFLAMEDAVRGFAATGDPFFSDAYDRKHSAFTALARMSASELGGLDGRELAPQLIADEERTYQRWTQTVGSPIVDGHRRGPQAADLLRNADTTLETRMAADDRRLTILLDDVASASDVRRQTFLRRILFGSVSLVVAAAAVLATLLEARAAAGRRELRQTILYDEERRVTSLLQSALIPDRLPPIANVDLSAIYMPAALERQVGGDWFEALELHDGRILLLVGDVAGHGLGAAVVMNRARQAILGAAIRADDPSSILTEANRVLTTQSAGMVTAVCCVFDPGTMQLVYATAGHPPPIVAARSGVRAMEYGGAPLGVIEDPEVASFERTLEHASLVVLYTDGAIENDLDALRGEASLIAAAEQHRDASDPAAAIFGSLFGQRRPRDDVAILTMRV
jgi:serine phosphatase RsbU (regulator of sigma subunit)